MGKRKDAVQKGPWELLAQEVPWLVAKLEEMRPPHVLVVVDGADVAALVWRPDALRQAPPPKAARGKLSAAETALLALVHAAALNHPEPEAIEVHGVWPEEGRRVRLVGVRPVGPEPPDPLDGWAHA